MAAPDPDARREKRHREARRVILDAAEALLLERGADGFSMRRLANRCGYTAPTLYHYFGDKKGLLDTLLEEAFAGLLRELDAAAEDGDPLRSLRANFLAIVRFGVENIRHYQMLLAARPEDAEPLASEEAARQRLEQPLDALIRAGRIRAPDPEPVRQALWALLHGLISLQATRPDVEWSPELAPLALDAMLAGLMQGPGVRGVAS